MNGYLFNDDNQLLIKISLPLSILKNHTYYIKTSINDTPTSYISYRYKENENAINNDMIFKNFENRDYLNIVNLINDIDKISFNDVNIDFSIFYKLPNDKSQFKFCIEGITSNIKLNVNLGFASINKTNDIISYTERIYLINKGGN